MKILNFCGLPSLATIVPDAEACEHVVVVTKGTFAMSGHGPKRASQQVELCTCDVHWGDPESSSVRYEHDFSLTKTRCDVVLNGHAHAPGGRPVTSSPVHLRFGSIDKTVMVTGDRVWAARGFGVFSPSDPKPFVSIPLRWERAFGGMSDDGKAYEARNPIGCGLVGIGPDGLVAGLPVPNLERLDGLLASSASRPSPVGYGFVGRGWQPRLALAGTYDDLWKETRYPQLPVDFDLRYYQGAPPDQQIDFPRGGERGVVINASPKGRFDFEIPRLELPVVVEHRGGETIGESRLDTLVIEPDEDRIIATYRCTLRCTWKSVETHRIRLGVPTPAFHKAVAQSKVYVDWRSTFPPEDSREE
ncbi:MAG: DUF2169 domain-containing protein [Myxococcota bacterium]